MNLATLYFRYYMHESEIYEKTQEKEVRAIVEDDASTSSAPTAPHTPASSPARKCLNFGTNLRVLWEYRYVLLGTASTWFLIDVTFYGQSLMNTTVVNSAVATTSGASDIVALRESLKGTIYIMLIALPGYWFSIWLVDRMGRWWLTMMGFFMSALWFAVLSGGYNGSTGLGPDGPSAAGAFVVVYGLTYFFANFGPVRSVLE
jgi:hypothetical protein